MEKKYGSQRPLLIVILAGVVLATGAIILSGVFTSESKNDDLVSRQPFPEDAGGPSVVVENLNPVNGTEAGWRNSEAATPESDPSDAPAVITARISDSHTGEAVPRFTAWIFEGAVDDPELQSKIQRGKAFISTGGVLRFKDLDEGEYTLLVKSAGYSDLLVPGLRVPQARSILELAISRGTHIAGTVLDSSGMPVPNMVVLIKAEPFNPNDPPQARTSSVTDTRGRFLFGDLVPGRYEIHLEEFDSDLGGLKDVFLNAGDGFTHDFMVPDFNDLEFAVSFRGGRPIPNAHIRLSSNKNVFQARTDEKGAAVLKRIPPGEYDLEISKSRFKTHRERVSLRSLSGEQIYERYLELGW